MITAHYIPGPGVMLAKATTDIMEKALTIVEKIRHLAMILIAGAIAVGMWVRDADYSIAEFKAFKAQSEIQDRIALEHRIRMEEQVKHNEIAISKTMSVDTLTAKLEAIERTLRSLEESIRTKNP